MVICAEYVIAYQADAQSGECYALDRKTIALQALHAAGGGAAVEACRHQSLQGSAGSQEFDC